MNEKFFWHRIQNGQDEGQKGQSIVLIAFMLIGLLAFVGIAVDVGLVFARNSQLQAAVDAAALAAVTELAGDSGLSAADTKAGQFLNANGVPVSVTLSLQSSRDTTILGEMQYSLTATWPVDLFFLKLIGRDQVNITKSATAAFFPLADIYASRRVESGALSTSNQGIFGPNICIDYGDPFSPLNSPWEPGFYTYKYRILIPEDYPSDVLRVELFDPDSYNQAQNNNFTVNHTQTAIDRGFPLQETKNCGSDDRDRRNPCLIETGELNIVDSDPAVRMDHVNPFWFVRIDENRGAGGAPGDGSCGSPTNYDERYNTETVYTLHYYRENPDGTIADLTLATYTGRKDNAHQTDMRWVSPGGTMIYDQPAPVPVNRGSRRDFELSISNDLPGILTDPNTGNRYVYLDVQTTEGSSENGFEIWAGPPTYVNSISSDVNTRNVQVVNNPASHSSEGATVFGIGRLPMNSNFGRSGVSDPVDIPLVYIGPEYAGESLFVSLYDSDSGADPPITFFFDSVSINDWSMTFGVSGQEDPDGVADGVRCKPGSCNTKWVDPVYEITVPGDLDSCDRSNPTPTECTPFYGGRLVARYDGGQHDTYGWQVTLSGLPYLVK